VLLFMTGAVLGFFAVKGAAFGTFGAVAREPVHPVLPLWAFAHVLAAGGAILAAWTADQVIGGTVAWPVAGFLATSVFFLLNAVQTALAARTRAAGTRR
jgi:predicted GNAT superfamily acetyltransferase